MDKLITYFKGVKAEWGKITWPDRRQVIAQTIIVLVVVCIFTLITFGMDIVFKAVIDAVCEAAKHIGLIR